MFHASKVWTTPRLANHGWYWYKHLYIIKVWDTDFCVCLCTPGRKANTLRYIDIYIYISHIYLYIYIHVFMFIYLNFNIYIYILYILFIYIFINVYHTIKKDDPSDQPWSTTRANRLPSWRPWSVSWRQKSCCRWRLFVWPPKRRCFPQRGEEENWGRERIRNNRETTSKWEMTGDVWLASIRLLNGFCWNMLHFRKSHVVDYCDCKYIMQVSADGKVGWKVLVCWFFFTFTCVSLCI